MTRAFASKTECTVGKKTKDRSQETEGGCRRWTCASGCYGFAETEGGPFGLNGCVGGQQTV